MKVCTDSSIFGAWTEPVKTEEHFRVLDIGTGTGLLSLMLAQRYENAEIDAIEIDEDAYLQAKENFLQSPWADRLNATHSDICDFPLKEKYDFILSNPPFFHLSLKSPNQRVNMARHVHTLNEINLVQVIDKHLNDKGSFSLMISFEHRAIYLQAAQKAGWFSWKELWLRQTPAHGYFRAFIQFRKQSLKPEKLEMCIKENNTTYSDTYYKLMKDYLL